jgi:hypothetical protein
MREDTIGRKKASHLFQELRGRRWLLGRMLEGFTGSGLARLLKNSPSSKKESLGSLLVC